MPPRREERTIGTGTWPGAPSRSVSLARQGSHLFIGIHADTLPMQPITVLPVEGLPLIRIGDDLEKMITDTIPLQDGDILVIASTASCTTSLARSASLRAVSAIRWALAVSSAVADTRRVICVRVADISCCVAACCSLRRERLSAPWRMPSAFAMMSLVFAEIFSMLCSS